MHEKLKSTYNTYVNRFLSEAEKLEFNVVLEQGRFAIADDDQPQRKGTIQSTYKSVKERSIVNTNGEVHLDDGLEESKMNETDGIGQVQKNMVNLNAQGTKNMMRMKRGDEDLVEDEYTIKKNQMYRDEEFDTGAIDATESLAE